VRPDRRRFLRMAAAASFLGPLRVPAGERERGLVACRSTANGRHLLTALDADGGVRFDLPLPARGHGVAIQPGGTQCAVFARRPGTFLYVIDLAHGTPLHRLESPEDRHYCGHGVFDPAGRLLYVTENDYANGRGVIGVYDAADGYQRLGELPSHGIDPHEICFRRDGRTLVVANGGIRTHPDAGRSKLNLGEMDSSLAFVDATDGRWLGDVRPPPDLRQLSIRHIDVAPDDTVCIAMQFEGAVDRHPPIVALHRSQDGLTLLSAPAALQSTLRNYAGSACWDATGEWFAVSAPRGNCVTFWTAAGALAGVAPVPDGCGLAPGAVAGEFHLSSGNGDLLRWRATQSEGLPMAGPESRAHRWDNHLYAAR